MNKVILMGRLARDPVVRYSQGDNTMAIARYTLAVDRRGRRNNDGQQQTADFISCTAFGKSAEFAEKYLHKGTKLVVEGEFRPVLIPIRMVKRSTPLMWWWKARNLPRARVLPAVPILVLQPLPETAVPLSRHRRQSGQIQTDSCQSLTGLMRSCRSSKPENLLFKRKSRSTRCGFSVGQTRLEFFCILQTKNIHIEDNN